MDFTGQTVSDGDPRVLILPAFTGVEQATSDFKHKLHKLQARLRVEAPFGWSCQQITDTVQTGVENFFFCQLALQYDSSEQCFFYCYKDDNVQNANCQHTSSRVFSKRTGTHCNQCVGGQGTSRTFLKNLNQLLFETDDLPLIDNIKNNPPATSGSTQSQSFSIENVKVEKMLKVAEALLNYLEKLIKSKNGGTLLESGIRTIYEDFRKRVRLANTMIDPANSVVDSTLSQHILLRRQNIIKSARRFLTEGLLHSVLQAFTDRGSGMSTKHGRVLVQSMLPKFV
jgi:hypothetical protein